MDECGRTGSVLEEKAGINHGISKKSSHRSEMVGRLFDDFIYSHNPGLARHSDCGIGKITPSGLIPNAIETSESMSLHLFKS